MTDHEADVDAWQVDVAALLAAILKKPTIVLQR